MFQVKSGVEDTKVEFSPALEEPIAQDGWGSRGDPQLYS